MGENGKIGRWRVGLSNANFVPPRRDSFCILNGRPFHSCYDVKDFFLFPGHLPGVFFCSLMLIADQVKHSMDHQQNHHLHFAEAETVRLALGCFDRNHQVSEEVRMEGQEFALPHGKSEDIRGPIPSEMLPIQFPNPGIIDQQEAELGVKKPQFGQYLLGRPS